MDKPNILFKTRGGHKEGMGDITSSLALAEEFRSQGHEVSFIIKNNKKVVEIISQRGFEYKIIETLFELEEYISKRIIDVAILNQLNTAGDEVSIFRGHTKILVTFDDTGNGAKLADLRFNILYPIENSFSDIRYIALSSVFEKKHRIPKVIKEQVETMLVTQGGSDTYGYIPKIVKALSDIPDNVEIGVVLGPNFSHDRQLYEVLETVRRSFNIIKGKSDLSDLMLKADLAISAAGITLFELACLGVPTVMICGETFEVKTAERLQKDGFGINLGFGEYVDEKDIYNTVSALSCDVKLRSKMSTRGKELIDGYGIKRVVETINKLFSKKVG